MLTAKHTEGAARTACYVGPRGDITPIYVLNEIDPDKTVYRKNLSAYIKPKQFKSSNTRYPISEREQHAVHEAINNHIPVTKRDTDPIVYQYYCAIMEDINKRVATQIIAEERYKFYACPTLRHNQRDFIIISGPSGVGKSWWAADYCQTYKSTHPDRPIYLISAKEKDEALDELSYVTRVPYADWTNFFGMMASDERKLQKEKERLEREAKKERERLEKEARAGRGRQRVAAPADVPVRERDPVQIAVAAPPPLPAVVGPTVPMRKTWEKCLFVFDDIEHVPTDMREKVYEFKGYITLTGRSAEVDILLCNHMAMNYGQTREELNECTAVVMFPKSATIHHMNRYLKEYIGLDKDNVAQIINGRFRWVMLNTQHPMTAVTENEVWVVNKKQE